MLEEVQEAAASGIALRWIVPKNSSIGDQVAIFILPDGFVAMGRIEESPSKATFGNKDAYASQVGQIALSRNPISVERAAKAIPNWRWLTYPRSYTTLDPILADKVLALLTERSQSRSKPLLKSPPGDKDSAQDLSAFEGIAREVRVIMRNRSEKLRVEALSRAKGKCQSCGIDFSRVLAGKGVKVLQVHHIRQISLESEPVITSIEDLAVLCANCHALVHLDPKSAMPVKQLRALLRSEGRGA